MSPVGVTSTPRAARAARLGRYQVLGTLGAGGMAEVLLGRLVGPSGFERLVVMKRILPHLAKRRAFVDMFLDEARVVAQIRHPNVVDVHELGNEDGELFLVMEYLDGESAGGLARRLALQHERLPLAIAAYVVSEACAGLHAAHELTSVSGDPQNVVHRDVSPQNIFITYAGAVKILDFGIALAGDRLTRTEAGQIKGKFEYMAPEQWREEPLDRRADVFALGVVLYELTTGHRLFRRATHLETLAAACDAVIPPPSSFVPDYPAALERVCLKALARRREDRYATAADMRRDLLPLVSAADLEPEATLGRIMAHTFRDRREEKSAMVRAARAGDALASVPPADVDEAVELPVVVEPIRTNVVQVPREAAPTTRVADVPREPADTPTPPPRARTRIVGASVVALGVTALAVAVILMPRHRDDATSTAASAVASEAPVALADASIPTAASSAPPVSAPIEPAVASASAVTSAVASPPRPAKRPQPQPTPRRAPRVAPSAPPAPSAGFERIPL